MDPRPNANLAHLFLDRHIQAGQGDRVAVREAQHSWSYAQVQALSLHYAQSLTAIGLKAQERVLISLPEGLDWVGVFFAVLRRGSVVVMANPHISAEALAELAAYTQARVVVASQTRLDAPTRRALHRAYARQGRSAPHHWVPQRPPPNAPPPPLHCSPAPPEQDAIWLFSGGTTARPKAVRQSHGSFAFTTQAYAQGVLNLQPDDITISVPKLHFGYATGSNLLFPFSVGASCVLNPEPCNATDLAAQIHQHQATLLVHVPTMVAKMLAEPTIEPTQLSSLRLATCAGEALPVVLHERWNERFGIELLDGLGTAEMWHIFLSNTPGKVRCGSLGKVVPGFEIRLCNEQGQPVPVGEPGWMWVKGGALANGYWHRPEHNKEAFVGAWYRSGDLLRRDEDGYFYYCGRSGDFFKVSGKWLAPAEVESVLMNHPFVASAVVVGAQDAKGLQKPYAFVTLSPEGEPAFDEVALRQFVADTLEPYQSPRRIFVLDQWPKTHLGKIDRGRLRAMLPGLAALKLDGVSDKVSPSRAQPPQR